MRLRAHVRDRFGNLAAGAPVITAEQGNVSALEQHGDTWEGVYVPPRLFERSTTALSVRAADATSTRHVVLAPTVHALAVSARLGFLTNRRELHTPFAGAEVTVRSDRFGPQLGLALTLDGTSWSRTSLADTSGGTLQVHSSFTLLLASLGPVYRRPFGTRFAAFAQAGGVLALASTSAGVTATPAVSAHGAVPGLMAGAGVEAALYRTRLFVDLRYVATRAFGLDGLDGSLHALALAAGCRLELF
jgi:hypothetical protein